MRLIKWIIWKLAQKKVRADYFRMGIDDIMSMEEYLDHVKNKLFL